MVGAGGAGVKRAGGGEGFRGWTHVRPLPYLPRIMPDLPSPPSPLPDAVRRAWLLRPDIAFLNHGSFGGVPQVVFDAQTECRRRLEAEPIEQIARRMDAA